ncbi:hypothetical protein CP8484711_0765B, partial [Chlamydia psittaci 84-8471/1]
CYGGGIDEDQIRSGSCYL